VSTALALALRAAGRYCSAAGGWPGGASLGISGADTGVPPRAVISEAMRSWQMRRMTISGASQATITRAPCKLPGDACGSTHWAPSRVEAQPAASEAASAAAGSRKCLGWNAPTIVAPAVLRQKHRLIFILPDSLDHGE